MDPVSLLRSPFTQAFRFNNTTSLLHRSVSRCVPLLLDISSCDLTHRQDEVCSGRIAKSVRQAMIAKKSTLSEDYFLRGTTAMSVSFSKLSSLSGFKYGEAFVSRFVLVVSRTLFLLAN